MTIYTFLYPVIRANSREQSEAIWCAKDRGAAWRAQMIEGKSAAPKDPKCDTSALDRNIDLGGRLQVTGTPTVFVPNGQRAPGAVSLEYLEKMLAPSRTKINSRYGLICTAKPPKRFIFGRNAKGGFLYEKI